MDGERFDELTRLWAGARSRRSVLKAVIVVAATGIAGVAGRRLRGLTVRTMATTPTRASAANAAGRHAKRMASAVQGWCVATSRRALRDA